MSDILEKTENTETSEAVEAAVNKDMKKKRSKQDLQMEMQERKDRLVHSTTDLSAKLKNLLSSALSIFIAVSPQLPFPFQTFPSTI